MKVLRMRAYTASAKYGRDALSVPCHKIELLGDMLDTRVDTAAGGVLGGY